MSVESNSRPNTRDLCKTAGNAFLKAGKAPGWDQRRVAAQAHHQFSTFPDGETALEASESHPNMKKPIALADTVNNVDRL